MDRREVRATSAKHPVVAVPVADRSSDEQDTAFPREAYARRSRATCGSDECSPWVAGDGDVSDRLLVCSDVTGSTDRWSLFVTWPGLRRPSPRRSLVRARI